MKANEIKWTKFKVPFFTSPTLFSYFSSFFYRSIPMSSINNHTQREGEVMIVEDVGRERGVESQRRRIAKDRTTHGDLKTIKTNQFVDSGRSTLCCMLMSASPDTHFKKPLAASV